MKGDAITEQKRTGKNNEALFNLKNFNLKEWKRAKNSN